MALVVVSSANDCNHVNCNMRVMKAPAMNLWISHGFGGHGK